MFASGAQAPDYQLPACSCSAETAAVDVTPHPNPSRLASSLANKVGVESFHSGGPLLDHCPKASESYPVMAADPGQSVRLQEYDSIRIGIGSVRWTNREPDGGQH